MTSFIPLLISGIAAPFALSLVALLGYFVGLRHRQSPEDTTARETNVLHAKMNHADALLKQMDTVSRQLRHHLAAHHAALRHHRQQIVELSRQNRLGERYEDATIDSLLAPTDQLTREIALAYDQLRRDSRKLSQLRAW